MFLATSPTILKITKTLIRTNEHQVHVCAFICFFFNTCSLLGQCGLTQTDIVFALDSSAQVKEPDFVRMLQFCKDLVDGADFASGSVRVGLVQFGITAMEEFGLSDYTSKGDLFDAIDTVNNIKGRRNIADGIRLAKELLVRESRDPLVEKVIFLITAGVSRTKRRRTVREADAAKREGVHIFGVGIGIPNTDEIDAIVSNPTETKYLIDKFEALPDLSESLFMPKCEGKLLRRVNVNMCKISHVSCDIFGPKAIKSLHFQALLDCTP